MIKRTVFLGLFLLCFFSVAATAQTIVYPKHEAHISASILLRSLGGTSKGARFSYTRYRNDFFGWEVNGAVYDTGSRSGFQEKRQFLTAGPRLVNRGDMKTVFFHALAGISNFTTPVDNSVFPPGHRSGTGLAWQVGLGLDMNMSRHFGWRVLQFDLTGIRTPNPTDYDPVAQLSIVFGIVFKWGDVEN